MRGACGCVRCAMTRVAALHLTSACHAQGNNKIRSLDGVVFPAGLKILDLVSCGCCRYLFLWCVEVILCEARAGVYVVRLRVLRRCISRLHVIHRKTTKSAALMALFSLQD